MMETFLEWKQQKLLKRKSGEPSMTHNNFIWNEEKNDRFSPSSSPPYFLIFLFFTESSIVQVTLPLCTEYMRSRTYWYENVPLFDQLKPEKIWYWGTVDLKSSYKLRRSFQAFSVIFSIVGIILLQTNSINSERFIRTLTFLFYHTIHRTESTLFWSHIDIFSLHSYHHSCKQYTHHK